MANREKFRNSFVGHRCQKDGRLLSVWSVVGFRDSSIRLESKSLGSSA